MGIGDPAERDRRGRFQPGRSGNPGGRPVQDKALREMAAGYAWEALTVLLDVMRDGSAPPGARRQAARDLLRLAVGRDVPLQDARDLLAMAGLTHLPEYRPPVMPVTPSAPARPRPRLFIPPL